MPAKDLGTKHTCFKCSTRFYDLRKPEPLCPKCGADQRQSPASKPSSAAEKRRTAPKPAPPPKPEVKDAEGEAELDEDELDDEAEESEDGDEQ